MAASTCREAMLSMALAARREHPSLNGSLRSLMAPAVHSKPCLSTGR